MDASDAPKTTKSFEPVLEDYAFFLRHSTEISQLRIQVLKYLKQFPQKSEPIRILDLGCGDGAFSHYLESHSPVLKGNAQFCLVEPSPTAREQAVKCLTPVSQGKIEAYEFLPSDLKPVDLVISSHSLYYVPDLTSVLETILKALSPQSLFVAALEDDESSMIQIWGDFFQALGREIPFHLSKDFRVVLDSQKASYRIDHTYSVLQFPDTAKNRKHIARFLLEPHYSDLPEEKTLSLFDPHSKNGTIQMEKHDNVYVIPKDLAP